MAGYSATPLWKKLGYKSGCMAWLHATPVNYRALLALPPEVEVTWAPRLGRTVNFVHAFTRTQAELQPLLARARETIAVDGTFWVSWPKQAAKVATDITEGRIRDLALPLGWVDIKVCAVDETWSGLKLVIRKELR